MNQKLLPFIDTTKPLIILGDFNINVQTSHAINTFMSTAFNCTQRINEATTIANTTIDLVFTNTTLQYKTALYCPWSNHKTIQIALKTHD